MDFVEKIRKKLKIETRYKFAQLLRKSPQAYDSLMNAQDRITLRDLVALRRVSKLSDTALLDEIEDELAKRLPEVYEEIPGKRTR